jgi:hypothetical protein
MALSYLRPSFTPLHLDNCLLQCCVRALIAPAVRYGRLGLDDEQQQNTPSLCMTLQVTTASLLKPLTPFDGRVQGKGITSVSCGGFHTAALAASIGPEGD